MIPMDTRMIFRGSMRSPSQPTGNLDKATGQEITALLLELNTDIGLALVIATHNLELARQMSKQLVLVDGRFV